MSLSTLAKLRKTREMVGVLPPSERSRWEEVITQLLVPTTVAGEDPKPQTLDIEWDLWLANKLDGIYNAAADRVAEVATATKETIKQNLREVATEATGSVGKVAALVAGGAALGVLALWKLGGARA